MQMHEVKRPGPGHDRSETTPDRVPAAFYSLYRERREGGRGVVWNVENRHGCCLRS